MNRNVSTPPVHAVKADLGITPRWAAASTCVHQYCDHKSAYSAWLLWQTFPLHNGKHEYKRSSWHYMGEAMPICGLPQADMVVIMNQLFYELTYPFLVPCTSDPEII